MLPAELMLQMPLWVKQAIDGWLNTAETERGPIFRRVSANCRVGKNALTGHLWGGVFPSDWRG